MAATTHKICTKCKEQKLLANFYKDSRIKDGHTSGCKECVCAHYRNVYDPDKERKRKKASHCPEKRHAYYVSSKEKTSEYYMRVTKYKFQNDVKYRESVRERKRVYKRNKYRNDPNFRLRHNLSRRILKAIQSKNKTCNTLTLLGVENIDEVRKHLENQFTNDMSWDNRKSFEIDHIIPLSVFNLVEPLQQKIACHYTNLQPLTKEDNNRKADKTPDGFNLNKYINAKRMELNI